MLKKSFIKFSTGHSLEIFCDGTFQELAGLRLLHLRVDPSSNPGHPRLLCSLHGSPGVHVIKLFKAVI